MEVSAQSIRESLKKDGVVVLRRLLDPTLVRRAAEEVEALLRADVVERRMAGTDRLKFEGTAGKTELDASKHILLDLFAKSPTLDGLVERLLTDPRIEAVLDQMVGKHRKLRGYNVRRMIGTRDDTAMEWHRDNRGEFTFAILLDETTPQGDATTCFVPGSHLFPYCPRPLYVTPDLEQYSPALGPFSRRLVEKVLKETTSACGSPGDVCLFLGETWHGRQPNLNGRRGTVFFFAVFPGEIPFPASFPVVIPPPEVLAKLPPALRTVVEHDKVGPNPNRSGYVYTLEKERKPSGPFSLWNLALVERRLQFVSLRVRLKRKANALFQRWTRKVRIASNPATQP